MTIGRFWTAPVASFMGLLWITTFSYMICGVYLDDIEAPEDDLAALSNNRACRMDHASLPKLHNTDDFIVGKIDCLCLHYKFKIFI